MRLPPACTAPGLAVWESLCLGGHAWGSQDPCRQHRGRTAGEAAGDTQRPASPQALCSVILQLLSSGSWTQATEMFVVVNAPHTYLHLARLRAQNSEGFTLFVIARVTWALGLGPRPKLTNDQRLRPLPTAGCRPQQPDGHKTSRALRDIQSFRQKSGLGSQPPPILPSCWHCN